MSARAQRACNVCSDAPELCARLPRPQLEPCYLLLLRVLRLLLLRARRTWKGIPGPLRPGRPPRLGDHERCRVTRDGQQAAQVCCADRPATPCLTSDRHVLPWSPPLAGSFLTWTACCVLREAGEGLALLAEQALPPRVAGARASSSNHVITEQKRRDRINKGCAAGAAALTSCRRRCGTRWPRAAETGAPGARSFDKLRTLIQVEVKLDKAAFLSAVVHYIKQVQVRTCMQSALSCTCVALCMKCIACWAVARVELGRASAGRAGRPAGRHGRRGAVRRTQVADTDAAAAGHAQGARADCAWAGGCCPGACPRCSGACGAAGYCAGAHAGACGGRCGGACGACGLGTGLRAVRQPAA